MGPSIPPSNLHRWQRIPNPILLNERFHRWLDRFHRWVPTTGLCRTKNHLRPNLPMQQTNGTRFLRLFVSCLLLIRYLFILLADNDCDGVCHNEKCVECSNNNDCHNGGICEKNICLGCKSTADCSNGQVCSDQDMCVDCTKDGHCSNGTTCERGQCVECSSDSDCGNSDRCFDSRCVECRNSGHCALDQQCHKQKYCY